MKREKGPSFAPCLHSPGFHGSVKNSWKKRKLHASLRKSVATLRTANRCTAKPLPSSQRLDPSLWMNAVIAKNNGLPTLDREYSKNSHPAYLWNVRSMNPTRTQSMRTTLGHAPVSYALSLHAPTICIFNGINKLNYLIELLTFCSILNSKLL